MDCWVCTVEMHARRGAEITWIHPEEDASATRRAVFEAELPFACLGEASSSRARDVRDHRPPQPAKGSPATPHVAGIAL